MTARTRTAAITCCLVGLGIAGDLTYVGFAGIAPAREIAHGSERVQTS